jgi:AraC family transcriptional regulator
MIAKKSLKVEVRDNPALHVAYVRHVGPYKGDTALFERLFAQLFSWAGLRGLLASPDLKVLVAYHDDPALTDESELRTSVCITVPANTKGEGDVKTMTIPAGTYAIAHFELDPTEYEAAWLALYGTWLPGSGYQHDRDRPAFEMYLNDPHEHLEHKHIVDIYLPSKKR